MATDKIKHIEQRMNELGIEKFHMLAMTVEVESGIQKEYIGAYNEYLFLVSESIPGYMIIHSDTEIFISPVEQPSEALAKEFSGMTIIESNSQDDIRLDFIRVIPQDKGGQHV